MSYSRITRAVVKPLLTIDLTLIKQDTGTEYTIKGYLQTVTEVELLARAGIWERYSVRGFFLPFYSIDGSIVKVEEGDRIKDPDGNEYVVGRVITQWYNGEAIYVEAYMEGV